jgi:oligopeptide/dipeptide ABC transporter ATP-binding protein
MHDTPSTASAPHTGLEVQGVSIALAARPRAVVAVQDVSLSIPSGRTLALAGESGSGKSLLALAIAGLLPDAACVSAGRVRLDGRELLELTAGERRRCAGSEIGIVFQEPMTALNPVLRVGGQLAEVPQLHGHGAVEANAMALSMLERVRIADAARVFAAYPHELSGGMRQRVLIAMALILAPRLIIADEPTTALDATLQAEILALLQAFQRERGASMLVVSHDLAMLATVADDVVVLYAGRIVEQAPAVTIFSAPRHPYTQALLAARPTIGGVRKPLAAVEGGVPAPGQWPQGCAFAPRCAHAVERCRSAVPPLLPSVGAAGEHRVACFKAG